MRKILILSNMHDEEAVRKVEGIMSSFLAVYSINAANRSIVLENVSNDQLASIRRMLAENGFIVM